MPGCSLDYVADLILFKTCALSTQSLHYQLLLKATYNVWQMEVSASHNYSRLVRLHEIIPAQAVTG